MTIEKNEKVYPGRWLGGVSLILGPLLLLLGIVLRFKFDFFFPDQLKAFDKYPALITTAYSFFAAGITLLIPAVILLGKRIAVTNSGWAFWGCTFTLFGLATRLFHAGVDHLAFQLVRTQGTNTAIEVIATSYGSFHIFKTFNLAIMLGWIVLAIGAYRARTLPIIRCILLALMSSLPLGVLKGSTLFSVIAAAGLCLALVPLGLRVLREGTRPSFPSIFVWVFGSCFMIGIFYLFGNAG